MNGLSQLTGAVLDYLAGTGKFEDVKLLQAFLPGTGPYPITRPMLALRPKSAAVKRTVFSDDYGEEGASSVRGRMAQIECCAEIYVPAGQDGTAAQALFDRLCSVLLLTQNPFCIHTAIISKQTYEKALEAFRIEAVFSLDAVLASDGAADESTENGPAAVSPADMPGIHGTGWSEASLSEPGNTLRVLPIASGEDVSIWAGEHKLAQVEGYQVVADRALHLIEACEEASPVGFVSGEPVYKIVLDRVWALPMAEDLESLDSFTLTVRRPGCEVRYGGCVWTRLERSARGNGLLLEKAEIMAFSRTVSHMEGVKTGWNTEDKE